MSVLDTFFILFKADTSDLEKGQKSALKTTSDLQDRIKSTIAAAQDLGASFVAMAEQAASAFSSIASQPEGSGKTFYNGAEEKDNNAQKASINLLGLSKNALAATGIVVGLGAAIKSAISSDETTLGIDRFSRAVGVNTQKMEVWQRAIKNVAGEGASIMPTVQSLSESLNKSKMFGGLGALPADNILMNLKNNGVNISGKEGDAFDILGEMAEAIDRMRASGQAAGFSPDKIQQKIESMVTSQWKLSTNDLLLLGQGSPELQKSLQDIFKAGVPNPAQIAQLNQFTKEWGNVKQQIINFGVAASTFVLPAIEALITPSADLSEKLQNLKKAFEVVGAALLISANLLFPAATAAVTTFIISLWPLAAIAAVILAVYALFEYGPKIFKAFGHAFEWAFKGVKDVILDTIKLIKEFFGWMEKLAGFKSSNTSKDGKAQSNTSKDGKAQLDKDAAAIAAAHRAVTGAAGSSIGLRGGNTSSKHVNIGNITINTQATDASGIAGDLMKHINLATMTLGNDGQLA
jgi:hypothetical protein